MIKVNVISFLLLPNAFFRVFLALLAIETTGEAIYAPPPSW